MSESSHSTSFVDSGPRKVYVETSNVLANDAASQQAGGQFHTFAAQHWMVVVKPGKRYQAANNGTINGAWCTDNVHDTGFGRRKSGLTSKTDTEIAAWIERWNSNGKPYCLLTNSCQTFATDLVHYLCAGAGRLPHSAGVQYHADSNCLNAAAGIGEVFCTSKGSAKAAISGPNVGVLSTNQGLFTQAEIAHVGVAADTRVGRLSAYWSPNLNTGVGIRDGNAEVTVLGWGAKVGKDGIEVRSSLAGASCNLM